MNEYYKILGINPNSSKDEIRSAYKSLAKKYHPDINKDPGAEEKFKEIKHAYDQVASNQKIDFGFNAELFNRYKEAVYDQREYSLDLEAQVSISFEEGCFGVDRTITYNYRDKCLDCEEYKEKNGNYKFGNCLECNGTGRAHRNNASFSITYSCHSCRGSGRAIECSTCKGKCNLQKEKSLNIKVPIGLDSGVALRALGGGNYDPKTKNYGNLFIRVIIASHPFFTRKNKDIYSGIEVDFLKCVLGAEIEVDSIHGPALITIPEYSDHNTVIAMNNLGVEDGKHYFTIKLKMPEFIDEKERKILKILEKYRKKRSNKLI